MLNATEISERIDMNKSKVLKLINEGVLPICEEKKVRFHGRTVTVKYVSLDEVEKFKTTDIYKVYIEKRTKRKEKALLKQLAAEEEYKRKREIRHKEIVEYVESRGGLTDSLLSDVAFAFSKRAKNSVDYDIRKDFYDKKDMILKRYKPVEIHLNKRHITYIDYPEDEYIPYEMRDMYRVEKDVIDVLEYFVIDKNTFHRPIYRLDSMNEVGDIETNLNIKNIELNSRIIEDEFLLDEDICEYVIDMLKKEEQEKLLV